MSDLIPLLALVGLGVYHGINPGMGWLFAVALGLQERSRRVVLRSLGPIAIGHAASVALVVIVVGVAQSFVSVELIGVLGSVALIGFGLYKWLAPMSHPRWVSMRVGAKELVAWSFLMATAHGAGLMLVPVVLAREDASAAALAHDDHARHLVAATNSQSSDSWYELPDLMAVGIHTLALFVTMGLVAVVIFEKLGLRILRRGWFNLDRVWAATLFLTGAITLFI